MSKKIIFGLESGIENFGVLLKGGSLDKLQKYKNKFKDCFIVSDYDDELAVLSNFLKGKNIIHFRNRERVSTLTKENYLKFNIKHVQLGQVLRWTHIELIRSYLDYKFMNIGLTVHFLPECMRKFNDDFDDQYRLKFPNTGILSILFALEIIKPKNLWIFGLDFYAVDYFTKQLKNPNDQNPISKRNDKMNRLSLDTYIKNTFKVYEKTSINIASYHDDWPSLKNLNILE